MTWILLALSMGSYNFGNLSGIEFEDQKACNEARDALKSHFKYADTICVPKGSVQKK